MTVPSLQSPILLLLYNRPEATSVLFEKIREMRPSQLFVATDGPTKGTEDENKCAEVRAVMEQVDWDCIVTTLYRDDHLGCRIAVSSAIAWFFTHVDEGIILEDDCIPNSSFFRFCDELLAYYRDDKRVMQVCGSNLVCDSGLQESYFFSRYGPIWGWATWKRAWQFYDVDMKLWPMVKRENFVDFFCDSKDERTWRINLFDLVYQNKIDTWDYQWTFAKLLQSGLSVIPRENLINNIGFHPSATHTKIRPYSLNKIVQKEMDFPAQHPLVVLRNKRLDRRYYRENVHSCHIKSLQRKIVSLFNTEQKSMTTPSKT